MLGVTFFGLLLTPVFYVLIRNFVERKEARKAAKAQRVQSIAPEAH
jgi:multidrug efflux pump